MTTIAQSSATAQLDLLAHAFAEQHAAVADIVESIDAEMRAIRRQHRRRLGSALSKLADRQAALTNHIDAHRDHFVKPKTITLHGIKVGLQKGKGKLLVPDEARTVALIRKHLPDLAETLVRVSESVNKPAANALPTADLRRVGITLVESGEEIVVKPVAGEVEKLIAKIAAEIAAEEEAV